MAEKTIFGNDYIQYRTLCDLESIAKQYPQGKDYAKKVHGLAEKMESKNYRVAVIGEFKRGKSSMINALLGANVLPTDILPMTATVNRIVYGTQKEIFIEYQDGRTQRADIDELSEYVTKMSEHQARIAETVKEVKVSYPSVFCKNHIEIFDTPGLNDDELMTGVTLEVLEKIDAAIVVISAVIPFSMTERDLTVKLLEYPEISNIVFVITFIDKVSSRRSDQDRVIDYISSCISKNTMQQVQLLHGDDEKFLAKAHAILEKPKVFAVSSTLALKGFLYDEEKVLEESRFPEFKYSLLEVMTAAQSVDMFQKVTAAVEEAWQSIDIWYGEKEKQFETEDGCNEASYRKCEEYAAFSRNKVEELLLETDKQLENAGIDAVHGLRIGAMVGSLRSIFITALSSLNGSEITRHTISSALENASKEALQKMEQLRQNIENTLIQNRKKYEEMRKAEYTDVIEAAWNIRVPAHILDAMDIGLPEFKWNGCLYPEHIDLLRVDIVPIINERMVESVDEFRKSSDSRIALFRKTLLRQNDADKEFLDTVKMHWNRIKGQVPLQREMCRIQYQQHKQQIMTLLASEAH